MPRGPARVSGRMPIKFCQCACISRDARDVDRHVRDLTRTALDKSSAFSRCKPQLARVCPALFALRSSHPHHSLWHCRRLACGLSCHLATKLRSRSPEDSPSRSLHKACPFLYIPPSNVQPIAKPTGTMYPLGFLPFFYSLVPDSVAVGAAAAVPLLALALWLYGVLPRSPSSSSLTPGDDDDDDAPVHLPGSSLSHILPFFRHRFDFLNEGFQLAGQAIYQFSLLRVRVRHGHCARLGQRGGIPHRARRGGRRQPGRCG